MPGATPDRGRGKGKRGVVFLVFVGGSCCFDARYATDSVEANFAQWALQQQAITGRRNEKDLHDNGRQRKTRAKIETKTRITTKTKTTR